MALVVREWKGCEMEVEAKTLICESHEKVKDITVKDRKFPRLNIYDHLNETSADAKELGLVSSVYTVLQTEVFFQKIWKNA